MVYSVILILYYFFVRFSVAPFIDSLATLVRQITSATTNLAASPVKSYGGGAGVVFCGACPHWSIERSCDASLASFGFRRTRSRRWGAEPPQVLRRGRGGRVFKRRWILAAKQRVCIVAGSALPTKQRSKRAIRLSYTQILCIQPEHKARYLIISQTFLGGSLKPISI